MKKVSKHNLLVVILLTVGLSVIVLGCDNDKSSKPKAPEISSLTANPNAVEVNGTVTLTCTANHPEGFPLEYIWETTAGSISGSGSSITWIAPGSSGQYTVICKVVDSNGKQDTRSLSIDVTAARSLVDDMTVRLSWSMSGDMDIRMWEPDGSYTTEFQNGTTGRHSGDIQSGTGPEVITVKTAADGMYGIEMYSFSGQTQTARLEITLRGVSKTYSCQVFPGAGGQVVTAAFPDARESLVSNLPAGITCM